jgi:hypothetical protein
MAVFAVVNPEGGVVTNTIVGDSLESITQFVGACVEITEATGGASIGDIWDGTTFTRPQ